MTLHTNFTFSGCFLPLSIQQSSIHIVETFSILGTPQVYRDRHSTIFTLQESSSFLAQPQHIRVPSSIARNLQDRRLSEYISTIQYWQAMVCPHELDDPQHSVVDDLLIHEQGPIQTPRFILYYRRILPLQQLRCRYCRQASASSRFIMQVTCVAAFSSRNVNKILSRRASAHLVRM